MAEFPHNLPVSASLPCWEDEKFSTSGISTCLFAYEKGFPWVEGAILKCLPEGIGKRSVEVVCCIIFTMVAVPIFSILGIIYNGAAAGIKAGYGAVHYLASKEKKGKAEAAEVEEHPAYERLFQEAFQHLCFTCIDITGAIFFSFEGIAGKLISLISATGFSLYQDQLREQFRAMEESITSGAAYKKVEEWGQDLGWVQVAEGDGEELPE